MYKQRIRLLLSYQGLKYYGWQKQKKHPTVQGVIEQALTQILQENISIIGASRTDTGTHALGQNAHFDISQPLRHRLNLKKSLNALLVKKDICVRAIWKAPPYFHALRSAEVKSYKYFILNRDRPCVFRKGQIYWYPFPLDIESLNQMNRLIEGRHDFKSFQNRGTVVQSTIRNIHLARWQKVGRDVLVLHIKADGFLKQMIRNLVGTQLRILDQIDIENTRINQTGYEISLTEEMFSSSGPDGKHEKSNNLHIKRKEGLRKWQAILQDRDRKSAYQSAPAEGLYLSRVYYPLELEKQCHKL